MTTRTVRLGEVAAFVSGYAFASERFGETGDLPLARIRDVDRGQSETYYAGPFEEKFVIGNGDLLIAMDGDFRVGYWRGGQALLNQRVCRAIPEESDLDLQYLGYALPRELQRIQDRTSFVTVKHLSVKQLRALKIPLPPLPEQRRIAAILDKADAVRRKRQQTLDLADQFLRSAFLNLFGDPVINPKRWPAKKLEGFADVRSGVTKGRKLGDAETISVPYMRVANVQDETLDLSDIKEIEIRPDELEKFRLCEGDLLLTEGGDPDKLGRGSVWTGEIDPCVHQNHIFSVRIDRTVADPYYLSALIGSAYGKRHFLRIGKQTTGIATINKTQLRAFPALLPPIELQQRYATIVARYEGSFDRLTRILSTHERLFSSLSQRAFRGELQSVVEGGET